MVIVPEVETVFILVPRTGSGSLKKALLERYPQAIQLYRHMEADGVPQGYDRWPKVGVVRDPVERLWSLYKFLETFDGPYEPAYISSMRESAKRYLFDDWLLYNGVVFTNQYDAAGSLKTWPRYTVRHPLPENRKSQFLYLRPDLGTRIYSFKDLYELEIEYDIKLGLENMTPQPRQIFSLSSKARDHVRRWFEWDLHITDTWEQYV